jgi:non-homologous end joining protein Ku
MAAAASWSGSIRLAGFPVAVKVYERVKDRRGQSFNMLDPVHKQRVRQQYVDVEGKVIDKAATLRGFEDGDKIVVLSDAAMELIEKKERSGLVDIEKFVPLTSVPLGLAVTKFVMVPDDKVHGAGDAVDILWNYLHASGLGAVVVNWTPRIGAKPSTLVIGASDNGLMAYLMPFAHEIKTDIPRYEPTVNAQAAKVMQRFVDADDHLSISDFQLDGYRDQSAERREQAIRMALSGDKSPKAAAADAIEIEAPMSLMDVLTKSVEQAEAKPKRKPAAKRAAKPKVAA